jgi:hypothetical protein
MKRFALFFVVLLLTGCKDEARQSYMSLQARVFIFNPRMATAVYAVGVSVLKDIPAGSRVVFTFEDPAGGPMMRKELKVVGGETKLGLESNELSCIKAGKPYAISVQLLDAAGAELQRIDSSVTSTLDQSVLPEAPLTVGPGYDPNTDLKRAPDGTFIRTKPQSCPP